MQELLAQLKEERNNLPMPKEWNNCLRSIELVIEKHYLEKERQQTTAAYIAAKMERNLVKKHFAYFLKLERVTDKAEQYYNETYNL